MSSEIERLRAENAALKAKLEGAYNFLLFVSRSLYSLNKEFPPTLFYYLT
jgi:hypothetical protein